MPPPPATASWFPIAAIPNRVAQDVLLWSPRTAVPRMLAAMSRTVAVAQTAGTGPAAVAVTTPATNHVAAA